MNEEGQSSWLDRVKSLFSDEPQNREELIQLLKEAVNRGLIEADAERMIERVLHVTDLRVRDVMIPRSKMDFVDDEDSLEAILQRIVEEGHSRYPVLGNGREEVLGVLMTKDVLRALVNGELNEKDDLRKLYRTPVFVPESKRLNVILREFKSGRTHLALVVDEYKELSGLITIEDVLEEIVGEIEDEYDEEEKYVRKRKGFFLVDAQMPLEDFNRYFNRDLSCEAVETIGGCVVKELAHIPEEGEVLELDGMRLEVVKSDGRRVRELKLILPDEAEGDAVAAES